MARFQIPSPPIPPAPPQTPVPFGVRVGAIPGAADQGTLVSQLADLRAQQAGLRAQWTSLREQLQAMTPTNTARPGVAQQWADVGSQLAQVQRDIAVVQARLGQSTAPGAPGADGGRNFRNGPNPNMIAGLSMGLLMIFAIPISLAWARRIWRGKPQPAGPRYDEFSQRFDRLEQAVDAIAIEVERVSEGQRFVTKILAERAQPVPAAAAGAAGVGAAPSNQPLALGAGPAEPVRAAEREGAWQAR